MVNITLNLDCEYMAISSLCISGNFVFLGSIHKLKLLILRSWHLLDVMNDSFIILRLCKIVNTYLLYCCLFLDTSHIHLKKAENCKIKSNY